MQAQYFLRKYNVDVEFIQADLTDLSIISNESIDIIGSDAVFEHLKEFDKCLQEMKRVLSKDGLLYSTFGPLWNCWGGDHISGSDSFNNGYNMQTGGDREYIVSELVKEKLSIASKGIPKSDEHKKNIKKNHADFSGENNPMYGKHHTKEVREQISRTKKEKGNYWTGRKHTEESRAKMRKSQQEYHRKKREGLL